MGPLVLVSMVLLLVTVGWSLYEEFYGLRPWRSYQSRFQTLYSAYLEKQIADRRAAEQALQSTPDYQRLSEAVQAAASAALPTDREIQAEVDLLDRQRAAMTPAFQDARGRVGSLTYQLEQIPESDTGGRESAQQDVMEAKAITYDVDWPTAEGLTQRTFNYDQLNETFTQLMARKAELVARRGQVDQPAREAQRALDEFVRERLAGLGTNDLTGLLQSVRTMSVDLKQINVNPPGAQINWVGGAGLVDRCQSCHVATDPRLVPAVMAVSKADLGVAEDRNAPFASHPNPDLLRFHPLEKFGCSPCHGGNGRALDSVERAHGRYEHWLWPLNYPENYDAGCQQCHAADMVTEQATVLNRGKELFRERGCIGCHRFQGFDNQDEMLVAAQQRILQMGSERQASLLEIPRLNRQGDQAPDNAAANRFYQQANNLNVTIANMDAQIEQLEQRSHSLLQEIKKIGPDLKEVRMKLRKEWIPYWLQNTHTFRPTTKMPQFRLQPDEVQAISAFIWQSGLTGPALPRQAPGNAARGKQLFESRGCLACHSIGEGTAQMGGTFAANLSRVGEKANYEYLVRWVHNPRERTRPYCPFEKKDLGPEDYARHGLPYVFDLDHSRCPNDGHELVVQQPTPMPSLRLSEQDARDVASYLATQRHADASYEPAPFMDDPALTARGKSLVQFYGCAGCHEIATLEQEGRIGTELTNEGSKPIERLDFALLTESAKRGILPDGNPSPRGPWHDLKGFVENKLTNPAIFDTGKYKPNPADRLRMPKPNVTEADITALTTMLLGSTDPSLPPDYMYRPADDRANIQKGWWIVSKYNCMGCHEIGIGQTSVLSGLPMYQGENKVNLPPVLTSEGARVNPDWLRRFLADPSLGAANNNRNGVRDYLQVRMPTFSFSDDEIRSLILFFEAISHQARPYIPPTIETLTTNEITMARQLFTSTAAPCLRCHATGDPAHDATATAPNFLFAPDRLRPGWTERWLTNPQQIAPGTAMPSGLFRREGARWVFSGPLPASFSGYTGDHAQLLVRYMLQLSPQEQRMLLGRTPAAGAN
jgi:cytochrome c2